MNKIIFPAVVVIFWAGYVCSISFMEAWLKFRAPGVTRAVGLSIGSKIFRALNRVEWILFILFFVLVLLHFRDYPNRIFVLSATILLILIAQTFIWLPVLVKRAKRLIAGEVVEKSHVHISYISAEFIKVSILLYLGFYILSRFTPKF